MFDLRPVCHVIGLLVTALGVSMLIPLLTDLIAGNGHWGAFAESAAITTMIGLLVTIASANAETERLSIQQTFLMTSGLWFVLPIFGAIPFVLGATEARFVDAFSRQCRA
jgi:trk system potassium uptake protein TrkH